MIRRSSLFSRMSIAKAALGALLCPLFLATQSTPLHAQTKPSIEVPAETRGQAHKIVEELLRTNRIIRSSSVKRGMMGYALSVFQGTKIEKFPVVVLGTLQRVQGGGDIVLIKVLGGTVVKRDSGIIAGMSGSPVFINGKMLGAIALGWGFPKEPIGGVTPITEMIETSLPDPARAHPASASLPPVGNMKATVALRPSTPLTLAGHKIARVEVSRDPQRLALRGPEDGATMTMRPATTMLQIGGFSQKLLPRFKEMFEPYDMTPVIGPSSKKTGVPSPPLVPGSALGVQLVSGDMDQTAVGTVTFRWGNRILGFGHPMFGQGATSLPIVSAFVHEIFPSYQRSFKLASPIKVTGVMQQDTQFAIGGTLGMKADTIPMSVTVRDASRNIARKFNVQVMKDPVLTPQLIVLVASEAIESKLGLTSDRMVRVRLRMELDDAPPIVRTNYIYANDVVTKPALLDLAQSLMITQSNEFARGSIKRVSLDVSLENGRNVATIKAMTANKNKVKAGDSVQVTVVLEPMDKPNQPQSRTFEFKVPADAPPGAMRLAAGSSVNYWPLQARVGGAPPDPSNLRDLVKAWNRVGSFNELVVEASTPRSYLKIGDKVAPNPASTWARLLKSARTTAVGVYNEVDEQREITPYMLQGSQVLSIPIERNKESDESTEATTETPEEKAETTPAIENADETPDLTETDNDNGDANITKGKGASSSSSSFALLRMSAPLISSTGKWGAIDYSQQGSNSDFIADLARSAGYGVGDVMPMQTEKKPPPRETGDRPIADTSPKPEATPTPKPTATPKPTPTPVPTPKPFGSGKSVGRPAQSWIQSGAGEFLKGDFDNSFVTSLGEVRASPAVTPLVEVQEPFVWSLAADKNGNAYYGTGFSAGNRVRIVKVDSSGKESQLWIGDGAAVTAIAASDNGEIYASVSPGGKILRFSTDGKLASTIDTKQTYVWALEPTAKGLLVGTGGEAGVLYLLNGNALYEVTRVPQHHIRSLGVRGEDIFFGTGSEGVLYRFDAQHHLSALYQVGKGAVARQAEVLAIAPAPEGIYFGTSINGTIYRWTQKDGVDALYPSPQKVVYALARDENGNIYAATGEVGIVYQLTPETQDTDLRVARLLEPDQHQALSLATVPGKSGSLFIGTGNNGMIYRASAATPGASTYTSPVFDAKNVVQWGRLRMIGDSVSVATRTGNTTYPDAAWSGWQSVDNNDLGEMVVKSPEARFVQYRVNLDPTKSQSALARLEIVYRAGNSAPQITLTAPKGGEYWMGKKKATWTGKDPNGDKVQYRVFLSSDNAKTWQALGDGPTKTASLELDTTKQADGAYRLKVFGSDAIANPDDPKTDQQIGLQFVIDNTPPKLEAGIVKQDGDLWRLVGKSEDATSPITGAEWRFAMKKEKDEKDKTEKDAKKDDKKADDTKEEGGDGDEKEVTDAKVVTDEKNVPDDKKVPDEKEVTKQEGKDAGKKVKLKDGDWQAIAPGDGIFDSRREALVALLSKQQLDFLMKGADEGAKAEDTFQIEVRVFDAAGNSQVETIQLGK